MSTIKYSGQTGDELKRKGYCVTSNKYGIVSRLDRADWKEHLAQKHAPWDPAGQGMRWIEGIGDRGAADFYRRCNSADSIQNVPHDICKYLGNSLDGPDKFIDVP
jgi:hypothetical protein